MKFVSYESYFILSFVQVSYDYAEFTARPNNIPWCEWTSCHVIKSQPIFNRQLILNFFYSSLSLSPSYFNKREHREYNLFSLLIERNSFVTFPSSYKYVLRGS